MFAKVARVTMIVLGILTTMAGLLAVGFFAGAQYQAGQRTLATGGVQSPGLLLGLLPLAPPLPDGGTPTDLVTTFKPFWEAWGLVHDKYVDQPVDDEKLLQGAIRGMINSLGDKHTSYLTPGEYELLTSDLQGELEGIGAEVDTSGERVKIISPLPGSPAEAAGILPGDTILKVNDEDTLGLSGTEVILKVRGPAGTKVHLTMGRDGHAEPLEFDITRARITIPSVEGKMLDGGIAYVKINNFGDATARDLKKTLNDLKAQNPKGIVLDLRGNPGGYLDAAIEVVSQFIGDGTVMIERFGDGNEQTYTARPDGLALDLPLVVLINAGSASASEIVAGTIQDRHRGTLIGEKSYGKGTVQTSTTLSDNEGAVKITIARWLTPDGRSIHGQGLTPDVEVVRTEADRAAGLDPQLDKALEILNGG